MSIISGRLSKNVRKRMKKPYQREKTLQRMAYQQRKAKLSPYYTNEGSKKFQKHVNSLKAFFKQLVKGRPAYPSDANAELFDRFYMNHERLRWFINRTAIDVGGGFSAEYPAWFKNIAFDFLLELYQAWEQQAKKLNKEYYLKLWIFEKRFGESELVFSVPERGEQFDTQENSREIDFLTKDRQKKLEKFHIRYCKDYQFITKEHDSDFSCSDFEQHLIAIGYDIERTFLNTSDMVVDHLDHFINLGILKVTPTSTMTLYTYDTDNVWEIDLVR